MFSTRTFSKKWIEAAARKGGTQDVVMEKCIHALALVGRLSEAGLDFVFKGGTSLILHLNPVRRLSIDVDIASLEPLDRVREVLNRVADGKPFIRWEHQVRRDAENPPTKYFRALYRSPLRPEVEGSIQLDVLVTETLHPVIVKRAVRAPFVEVKRAVRVRVPSVNCLLGDKLSAFAPKTIGILYEPVSRRTGEPTEPRPIRVVKQLFDVGELFAAATDLRAVFRSYEIHFERQNRYRGGGFSMADALEDTLDAAYWLSQIGLKPDEKNKDAAFLQKGVKALSTHLINRRFTLQEAKTAAARVALLAISIKDGHFRRPLRELRVVPTDTAVLRAMRFDGRWKKLHTLRKTNSEAFYLWHLSHLLDSTSSP